MIFVTVGTHEQQFNRLIKYIDELIENGLIRENVIMQIGFSTYIPKNCTYKKFFNYKEIKEYIEKARIVITHGGPASFIMPLQIGKIPIVVPRQKKFNEHVNDHQLEFAKKVLNIQKNIILVENIESIDECIKKYTEKVLSISNKVVSNNKRFNVLFQSLVEDIID